jgi:glycosyltransferase involved in cell wall biosynthesis
MDAPLRVAVLARAVRPLHGEGGLERSVHDLVRHLALRGVHVTLITPPASIQRQQASDPFALPGVRIRHVSYLTFPFANRRGTTVLDRSTAYLLFGWRAGRLALDLASRGDIDIVHAFGASALGYALSSRPVPLVLNPQGLEEFGATGVLPFGKRIGYWPLRRAVRACARRASSILATDRSLEATVARHLRPSTGQMHMIPNGIDLEQTTAMAGPADGHLLRQRQGIGSHDVILLSVGRLERNKGFDVLAAALGRVARDGALASSHAWRWVVAGRGPFRADIERAATAAGIAPHVHFTGRIADADLHAWYEAATLFVHPTRYEGSSLVTLEAMAHRKAVIATRAGGLPDKVHPGENGWLVDPDDEVALAGAVDEALRDLVRLSAMGTASRAIVEREFAWSVLVDRQIELYRTLNRGRATSEVDL